MEFRDRWLKDVSRHRSKRLSSEIAVFGNYEDTSLNAATRTAELEKLHKQKNDKEKKRRRKYIFIRKQLHTRFIASKFCHLVRKLESRKRSEMIKIFNVSAAVIQSHWRSFTFYRDIMFEDLLDHSVLVLQCFMRKVASEKKLSILLESRLNGMIALVQAYVRGYLARAHLSKVLILRAFYASEIQKVFRGYSARNFTQNLIFNQVVTRFQKSIRVYLAKRKLERLRLEHEEDVHRRAEEYEMIFADKLSSRLENEDRERGKMNAEESLQRALIWSEKDALAKKQGIILLPWRKKLGSDFKTLLLQQQSKHKRQFRKNERTALVVSSNRAASVLRESAEWMKSAEKKVKDYRSKVLERLREQRKRNGIRREKSPHMGRDKYSPLTAEVSLEAEFPSFSSSEPFLEPNNRSHSFSNLELKKEYNLPKDQILRWIKKRREKESEAIRISRCHEAEKKLKIDSFHKKLEKHRLAKNSKYIKEKQIEDSRQAEELKAHIEQENQLQKLERLRALRKEEHRKEKLRSIIEKQQQNDRRAALEEEAKIKEDIALRKKELDEKARSLRKKIFLKLKARKNKKKKRKLHNLNLNLPLTQDDHRPMQKKELPQIKPTKHSLVFSLKLKPIQEGDSIGADDRVEITDLACSSRPYNDDSFED